MSSTNNTASPDTRSGLGEVSPQVRGTLAALAAEPTADRPEMSDGNRCPTCDGTGTIQVDRDEVARILHRVVLQAMTDSNADAWRRRAARWRAVVRPGGYLGQSTPEERAERRRRIEQQARACEMRAAVLEGPDAVLALAERLHLLDGPIVDRCAA